MEILSTIWQITQILLLIAVIISSVMLLTALIHPLRFDVKLRGSVKGQRAEVWFVYLFRLFKIGIIATPHTQDLVVSFMGWRKRLDRMGTRKPAAQKPPTTPPETTPPRTETKTADSGDKPATADKIPDSETEKTVSTQADQPAEPEEAAVVKPETTDEAAPIVEEPAIKDAEAASRIPDTTDTDDTAETTETTDTTDKSGESAAEKISEEPETIEPQPLKPLPEVEAEYKAAREAKSGEAGTEAKPGSAGSSTRSLKETLRRFKRDASRRFHQFKAYARLFRLKWRNLSPVLKRFWQRGKRGFGLPRIDLLLRYALHEPYLTGMCHGTLAVASGMAGQWGVNFVPVPQFGAPMLYSRACVTAVIRPWRLLYATLGLLFEKQLYKEIWQLFKWYRAKKTTLKNPS